MIFLVFCFVLKVISLLVSQDLCCFPVRHLIIESVAIASGFFALPWHVPMPSTASQSSPGQFSFYLLYPSDRAFFKLITTVSIGWWAILCLNIRLTFCRRVFLQRVLRARRIPLGDFCAADCSFLRPHFDTRTLVPLVTRACHGRKEPRFSNDRLHTLCQQCWQSLWLAQLILKRFIAKCILYSVASCYAKRQFKVD